MNKFKKFWQHFAGKGYYIALVLCAAAIGITGYLYYRNATGNNADVAVNGPTDASVGMPTGTNPTVTEPLQKPSIKTGLPLSGETMVSYTMDSLSYNPTTRDWRVHDGIDIAAAAGTEVCAAAAGEVYTIYEDDTLGTTVVLRHEGGYVTTYASLSKELKVQAGDTVTLGQALGTVDNSAPMESAIGDHVHFSVRCNDEPMDPMEFLNQD